MSGTTTISQSGNLAGLVTLQTSGSYVIEGNGVTVTTGPLLAIPAFDAFTVENGANLELGTGVVPGLFDTFTIASGGTLDVGSNLNLASDISFAPNSSGGDLVLAPGVSPLLLSTVNGFGGGDSIDVQGAGAPLSPTSFTEFFTGLDTEFIVTLANGLPEVFALPGNLTSQPLKLAPDNAGGFTFTDTACFAAGTAILTTEGEVLVEHLAPGDITVLADGATAEIKFIGRRHIDLRRHPAPKPSAPSASSPAPSVAACPPASWSSPQTTPSSSTTSSSRPKTLSTTPPSSRTTPSPKSNISTSNSPPTPSSSPKAPRPKATWTPATAASSKTAASRSSCTRT